MKKYYPKKILNFLNNLDIEIRSDLGGPKVPAHLEGENAEEWWYTNSYQVYFLKEFEDRSAGIFGEIISPTFKKEKKLFKWIKKNKEKLTKKYDLQSY